MRTFFVLLIVFVAGFVTLNVALRSELTFDQAASYPALNGGKQPLPNEKASYGFSSALIYSIDTGNADIDIGEFVPDTIWVPQE